MTDFMESQRDWEKVQLAKLAHMLAYWQKQPVEATKEIPENIGAAGRNIGAYTAGIVGDVASIVPGAQMAAGGQAPTSEDLLEEFGRKEHWSNLPAAFVAPGPGEVKGILKAMLGLGKEMTAGVALAQSLFHGSKRKFDMFELGKEGTGVGAQAYGRGISLTESPSEAGRYITAGGNKDIGGAGHLYEVDLPPETAGKMLDWDKPLNEQPENVKKAIDDLVDWDVFDKSDFDQNDLHNWIRMGGDEELAGAGVPGIRYIHESAKQNIKREKFNIGWVSRGDARKKPLVILKNPTQSELARNTTGDGLRWMDDADGNYYFWDSNATHDRVITELDKRGDVLFDHVIEEGAFSEDIITRKDIVDYNLRGYHPSAKRPENITLFNPDDIKTVKRDGELVYKAGKKKSLDEIIDIVDKY